MTYIFTEHKCRKLSMPPKVPRIPEEEMEAIIGGILKNRFDEFKDELAQYMGDLVM